MASPTVARDSSVIEMGDKFVFKGLIFHGHHGVNSEEKKLGQKFSVNVEAWTDLRAAGVSDNMSDAINFTAIYLIAKEVVEGQPRNLLESVAHLIASRTLKEHPKVAAVRVLVGKPHAPVQGSVDYLGVEITRFQATDV